MLAAMPASHNSSPQATVVARGSGDACPGTLRLHAADDGALARIRIPGGVLSVPQAGALADVAQRLGDGDLHLTSRGNVQVRGLEDGCGGELAAALDAAGLLPSPPHERVRNIVASPLSGLDGRGRTDVRPWLTALDAGLCASAATPSLSGRFLFALDDGRGDVAALGADVTVRATSDGGAELALGAHPEALRVSEEDAPRAALTAAETFLKAASASEGRAWRVTELPLNGAEFLELVAAALTVGGLPHERVDRAPASTPGPPPGVIGDSLSVHVPLGRLSAAQWRGLAALAAGELRLTPWRGVVLPTSAPPPDPVLDGVAADGLVVDPGSPWPRVGACIGSPGCAKSRADVRADAAAALAATGPRGLPLYWSGCERRCGHPPGDRIDLVAVPEGGYRVSTAVAGAEPRTTTMAGPTAPGPGVAGQPENLEQALAAALAAIAP
ncbi:precorrin-3B synthase [Streptomyces sp. NPDC058867]|uniref:precorrin-3B synthase n=1 Tax=unclassified Streptomyces TaxID=2593676 RepID=UPI003691CAC1